MISIPPRWGILPTWGYYFRFETKLGKIDCDREKIAHCNPGWVLFLSKLSIYAPAPQNGQKDSNNSF